MAWAVPDGFWRELRDRVKERDPEFLLLDETIPYIPDFQAGMFDMHFDSTTAFTLREIGAGSLDADAVVDAIEERRDVGFPDHASFMLYCENHDESRYVVECGAAAAPAAVGALTTLPGAPMLYAGQELGQRGRRDALAWEHADEALREHCSRLVDIRHAHPALSHGAALTPVEYTVADGEADRITAYARVADEATGATGGHEALVVVLNFGADPATVTVDAPVDATDLATGESVAVDGGVRVDSVAVLPADPGVFRSAR